MLRSCSIAASSSSARSSRDFTCARWPSRLSLNCSNRIEGPANSMATHFPRLLCRHFIIMDRQLPVLRILHDDAFCIGIDPFNPSFLAGRHRGITTRSNNRKYLARLLVCEFYSMSQQTSIMGIDRQGIVFWFPAFKVLSIDRHTKYLGTRFVQTVVPDNFTCT